MAKTSTDASSRTGIDSTSRCAMNFATPPPPAGLAGIVPHVESFVAKQRDRALHERRDLRERRVHALDLRKLPYRPVSSLRVHGSLAEEPGQERLDLGREQEVDEGAGFGGMLRAGQDRYGVRFDVGADAAVLVEPGLPDRIALHVED